jgi:hypothetical protein
VSCAMQKTGYVGCGTNGYLVITMISKNAKFLSAALALIATVAVARTIHTHVAPSDAHVTTGKVIGTTPAQTAPQGIMVCGMALDANCEKLETLLPM